jgi:hypothetical protein
MADESLDPAQGELTSRTPLQEDLVALCRHLNGTGARYIIVGGFAIITAGYPRLTVDVDILMDASPENEARVFKALESLPDRAVLQLRPGEVGEYTVVRVADEITVDLMKSASGIEYAEASAEIVTRVIDGVAIPFASPRLLWRMKRNTHREKDAPDLLFLREWFRARGEDPPA